jgi:hypothetical protein
MRFKQYLQEIYYIEIDDDILYEITSITGGDVSLNFQVPKANKEKFKKLNKKTNRMKTSRKTKYYKTNIPPEKRSFDNLPRYKGTNKPICRFQDWLDIDSSDQDFKKKGASGGKAANGKWYGYSHRAIYGFKPGDVIKNDDNMSHDPKRKKPYKIKDDNDAKWHAIRFSRSVA